MSSYNFVLQSSSDFVSELVREAITVRFIAIWQVFASDQWFLDFGEGFRGYLISLVFKQFFQKNSSDFILELAREAITVWFIAIWRVFASDKCFLDLVKDFEDT